MITDEDVEDRIVHGGELPLGDDFSLDAVVENVKGVELDDVVTGPSYTQTSISNPPQSYKIGDIYLKLELANQARGVEDNINSLYQKPDDRVFALQQAADDYEMCFEQSYKEYAKAEGKLVSKEMHLMDLNKKLCDNQNQVPFDRLKDIKLRKEIDITTAEIKVYEKKFHDCYTRTAMLSRYSSRLAVELTKSENGQPTPGFKMLYDDDQTV